jgi:hypothetical protein
MPTHLYCLLPAGSSVTPPAPVRAIAVRSGVAWVSDVESPRLSRDARDAARATVEHDRVVSVALAQGVTPVPASLADPYLDDAEMTSDVDAHAAEIQAAFPALDGMVEMTTIIAIHDETPPADMPNRGRAYLQQLRSLPDRAADVAARVERGMAQFSSARKRGDGGRVALSHLISRSLEPVYRAAATAMAGDGYRIVVDGPRAPYSFGVFAPRRGLTGGTILAT